MKMNKKNHVTGKFFPSLNLVTHQLSLLKDTIIYH